MEASGGIYSAGAAARFPLLVTAAAVSGGGACLAGTPIGRYGAVRGRSPGEP